MSGRGPIETLRIEGDQLLSQVERLIHEGNVRRIVIKQGEQVVVEFPLTVGVVGALLAPALAAVGAMAALLTDCTIEVERETAPPVDVAVQGPATTPPPVESGTAT